MCDTALNRNKGETVFVPSAFPCDALIGRGRPSAKFRALPSATGLEWGALESAGSFLASPAFHVDLKGIGDFDESFSICIATLCLVTPRLAQPIFRITDMAVSCSIFDTLDII